MLNKPEFKKLVRRIREDVETQKKEGFGTVAITKGIYTFMLPREIKMRDFDQSWPLVMRELGLKDDGTNTSTWTVEGHGLHETWGRERK